MRGGAQAQLLLCEDGQRRVVKFKNNPQHCRVLANELLATRLAEAIGLTVPKTAVVQVPAWLIESTPEMHIDLGRAKIPCEAGLQFGANDVGGLTLDDVMDYLLEPQLSKVCNLAEFAGILALDKWTGNVDGRQALFVPCLSGCHPHPLQVGVLPFSRVKFIVSRSSCGTCDPEQ